MNTAISLLDAQRRLAITWLGGALVLFGVVGAQALSGAWRDNSLPEKLDHTVGVFQWLFSAVVPNLTLILGVLAATEMNPGMGKKFRSEQRSTFFFKLTAGFTIFYLVAVLVFPVVASTYATAKERIQLLTYAGFVLPVLQGLAAGAIGVFFFKVEQVAASPAPDEPKTITAKPSMVANSDGTT